MCHLVIYYTENICKKLFNQKQWFNFLFVIWTVISLWPCLSVGKTVVGRSVRWLFLWLVGQLVCHNFLKGWKHAPIWALVNYWIQFVYNHFVFLFLTADLLVCQNFLKGWEIPCYRSTCYFLKKVLRSICVQSILYIFILFLLRTCILSLEPNKFGWNIKKKYVKTLVFSRSEGRLVGWLVGRSVIIFLKGTC